MKEQIRTDKIVGKWNSFGQKGDISAQYTRATTPVRGGRFRKAIELQVSRDGKKAGRLIVFQRRQPGLPFKAKGRGYIGSGVNYREG